jgi:hypothetical protein
VEKVSRFIGRFGLTVPAILALESMRPLSFVGSQFMHVLTPSIAVFLSVPEWEELARLLEDRRGLEVLVSGIERHDREHRKKRERSAT